MAQKIHLADFIADLSPFLETGMNQAPWKLISNLKEIISGIIPNLNSEFTIKDEIAIHRSAVIEKGVMIKSPFIAMANCHIGAHAYFREGVFLEESVKIGPGAEIKNSMICSGSAIAHLNYIGNSIIGRNVNFEAGSIAANHYNERTNKRISIKYKNEIIDTGVEKFGAIVGDNSRIGANSVLSPGTVLEKNTIVKRLELIEQYNPDK